MPEEELRELLEEGATLTMHRMRQLGVKVTAISTTSRKKSVLETLLNRTTSSINNQPLRLRKGAP
jgi:hypothetical protein